MLIYWIFMGAQGLFAMMEQSLDRARHRVNAPWLVFAALLALFIGLRWKTGGDWGNYYSNLQAFYWVGPMATGQTGKDAGFTLLSIVAAMFPTGIIVITLFSGVLMAAALLRFSLDQPRPWLCMTVAFPYLVVVCGMGYIRQGIAISFLLLGLVALRQGKVINYTAWAVTAALFHSTAVAMVPLGAFVSRRQRLLAVAIAAAATVIAFRSLLADRTEILMSAYVEAEADSAGALIRAFMNALPGAVFLLFRRSFNLERSYKLAWTLLAAAAVMQVPAVIFYASSTVVDRLGLYLLPVQCFVWSQVPDALARNRQQRVALATAVVALYIAIFFVFINYGDHARYWLPYRFFLFEDGLCLECGDPFGRTAE